ncbi:hypothetical protein MIFENG_34 [Hafnia phage vB_HpaM_Meifeng]|nr:hypothetical protein MIFENG_34 [Hafnia phage vB_HpaM_Meifeng]
MASSFILITYFDCGITKISVFLDCGKLGTTSPDVDKSRQQTITGRLGGLFIG